MDCIVVHGVAKSWTRLSDFHFTSLQAREKGRGKVQRSTLQPQRTTLQPHSSTPLEDCPFRGDSPGVESVLSLEPGWI